MKKPHHAIFIITFVFFHLIPIALFGSVYVFSEKAERTQKAIDGAYVDTDWIIGKTADEIEARYGASDQIYTGTGEYYTFYVISYENGVAVNVSLRP